MRKVRGLALAGPHAAFAVLPEIAIGTVLTKKG
jgi:hypothetical protein